MTPGVPADLYHPDPARGRSLRVMSYIYVYLVGRAPLCPAVGAVSEALEELAELGEVVGGTLVALGNRLGEALLRLVILAGEGKGDTAVIQCLGGCLLYTSPSPRD